MCIWAPPTPIQTQNNSVLLRAESFHRWASSLQCCNQRTPPLFHIAGSLLIGVYNSATMWQMCHNTAVKVYSTSSVLWTAVLVLADSTMLTSDIGLKPWFGHSLNFSIFSFNLIKCILSNSECYKSSKRL